MVKNKRGWIRIVEAFVAILLIVGILVIFLGGNELEREDLSTTIHDSQVSILRGIQLNDTLRQEIINTMDMVEWDDFSSVAPETEAKITSETPVGFTCVAQICDPSDLCLLTEQQEGSVYASSVLITSALDGFNPRQLKLFCWEA